MWNGDYKFLLRNLILKDFRIRYRNMSLGVFWSLLNPLVMVAVFTVVFTKFFAAPAPNYPLFLLCGLIPFNFFSSAWAAGTQSIVDNAGFIKRVPVPREVFPMATVLSVAVQSVLQAIILIVFAVAAGKYPNVHWVWLPVIGMLLVAVASGFALVFSAVNVYIRDTRYVVESAVTILFWLVPIFYPLTAVPVQWQNLYLMNPVSCAIVAVRNVILDAAPPTISVLMRLSVFAGAMYVAGWLVFRSLKARFYNYL
jgi:lipopolysaccharide transport system permease protein